MCNSLSKINNFISNRKSVTVNLSSIDLSDSDISVLDKGLTFVPTPKTLPVKTIIQNKNNLIRNIKLKSFFRDSSAIYDANVKRFREKSSWTPSSLQLPMDIVDTVAKIERATAEFIRDAERVTDLSGTKLILKDPNNITKDERASVLKLRKNNDIVIKKADKGSATVIMDRAHYVFEANRQLNDLNYYKKLDRPIYLDNAENIKSILQRMYADRFIDKKQFDFLCGPEKPRHRIFYLLPKIHKDPQKWTIKDKMPEGRPIVSDVNSEANRVSQYIDAVIAPLSVGHATYIKDTYDFINKIRHKIIPSDAFIVTGDVTALYTNMHHDRCIDSVRAMFAAHPDERRGDKYILELLNLTLRKNDFMFDGKCYLQCCGCPMGRAYSPNLANLYMLSFDDRAMNDFRIKPMFFFRFLDDIFFIWVGSEQELIEFDTFINSLIPGIKVTLQYSRTSANFLDTTIYKKSDDDVTTLLTRVYFKPTDTHQLLHRDSHHPKHTAKGVLKSQLLRFKRISSSWADYVVTAKILFHSLTSRGYSWSLMWNMLKDVWFNETDKQTKISAEPDKNSNKGLLPIIMPYDNAGLRLVKNYRQILQGNSFFDKFRIINSYQNHDNLYKMLIRSELRPQEAESTLVVQQPRPFNTAPSDGFILCNNIRCVTCTNHVTVSSREFASTAYGTKHSVEGTISCKTKSIVYLITCDLCRTQYVGETGNDLASRLANHRSDIKHKKNTAIAIHFNSHQGPTNAYTLRAIAIEKISSSNPSIAFRKKRELYWQNTLGTQYPLGLNGYPVQDDH